ncbi:uncharacterized protein LOC124938625 [Impatiens glandulifera]|uniref:uncharacterized protein LOC124938625 n=1 Tax=Impatiens glandulifera TaxID=253017 RepID=UPI001FB0AA1C|nr:uncharacterized protein LOC124938625 [Impatiens glandulifera]
MIRFPVLWEKIIFNSSYTLPLLTVIHFLNSISRSMMGCQIHTICRIPLTNSSSSSNNSSWRPSFCSLHHVRKIKQFSASISSSTIENPTITTDIKFQTLGACKLGISRYPDFEYNAQGGKGIGSGSNIIGGKIYVKFDEKSLYIPPLTSATTNFLGLPLPPFLRIDIVPQLFQGIIDQESGKVELEFKAKFLFSIGSIYRARPLIVETVLTSEKSEGKMRSGEGEKLNEEGNCRLVGVATVKPIDDVLLDNFLSLPTECLADLKANIIFLSSSL